MKQAKSQGNSGNEPKLHQGQNGEINLGRTQAQTSSGMSVYFHCLPTGLQD